MLRHTLKQLSETSKRLQEPELLTPNLCNQNLKYGVYQSGGLLVIQMLVFGVYCLATALLFIAACTAPGGILLYPLSLYVVWKIYRSMHANDSKQCEFKFNVWLGTFPVALIFTLVMIHSGFPLSMRSWFPHGGSDGYANAVFLPWIHLVLWQLIMYFSAE